MVETPLTPPRLRRWPGLPGLLAGLAVGFLLIMALTRRMPETRQLAKFEANGVLTSAPEAVQQVDLRCGEHAATFVRTAAGGWKRPGSAGSTSDALRDHLHQAVFFMHTAGPVRVLSPEEYQDISPQEFGLAPPRCSVQLSDQQHILLSVHFGANNPQDLLQYMQRAGHERIYLMSRFVGQAWEHLAEHLEGPPATP